MRAGPWCFEMQVGGPGSPGAPAQSIRGQWWSNGSIDQAARGGATSID